MPGPGFVRIQEKSATRSDRIPASSKTTSRTAVGLKMSSFVIEGGYKLSGTIRPQGAKNEALEVICAVLLTREEVIISNIPEILNVWG